MLNLKALKEKDRQKREAAKQTTRPSAALTRVVKDVNEMDLPSTCRTVFPDPDDLTNFKVIVCPEEGFYRGGRFVFDFRVGANYPHEPPSVKCETSVFHPNIDPEGNVCLNILRDEWNPVLTLGSVVLGLLVIFLEPNTEDPLNKHAAHMLLHDRQQFAEFVQGCIFSARYDAGTSSNRMFT
ncbi:nedd8-conjugating enzyme UbcE2M-like [Rhipicephalus sanguineus]|nr:nedd8-conjugating enzyme UbcE2M-like [Rhipicephalus sanguineus]